MSFLHLYQKKREFFKICHRNFYVLTKGKPNQICGLFTRHEKGEIKCQTDNGALTQQIRLLQYKDFGHRPTPTPISSGIWYLVIGGGMFITLFWDLPIMYETIVMF